MTTRAKTQTASTKNSSCWSRNYPPGIRLTCSVYRKQEWEQLLQTDMQQTVTPRTFLFCSSDAVNPMFKGIFHCKFNAWSNTPWHWVRPPPRSSFLTASLCSLSNLRKHSTITIHCTLCLQPGNRHQKATYSHKYCSEQHQTSATVQRGSQHIVRGIKQLLALPDFFWKDNTTHNSPAAVCSLWGSPEKSSTVTVRNDQFCSFPCPLSIITVINW